MTTQNWMFDPLELKNADDRELRDLLNGLIIQFNYNASLPLEISRNIEIEANMLMIYTAHIAKIESEMELIKLKADITEGKAIYQSRNDWKRENNDKPPAISYFEKKAEELVYEDRVKQSKLKADLTLWKKAFESVEAKMNAQKKILESMKYEVL